MVGRTQKQTNPGGISLLHLDSSIIVLEAELEINALTMDLATYENKVKSLYSQLDIPMLFEYLRFKNSVAPSLPSLCLSFYVSSTRLFEILLPGLPYRILR